MSAQGPPPMALATDHRGEQGPPYQKELLLVPVLIPVTLKCQHAITAVFTSEKTEARSGVEGLPSRGLSQGLGVQLV